MKTISFLTAAFLASAGAALADEPRPTPLTRPEMKKLLEDMKSRKPRIPLPELTAQEKEKLGERGSNYEGRIRALYLPQGDGFGFGGMRPPGTAGGPGGRPDAAARKAGGNGPGGAFGRNTDPNQTLDYAFKTELFWIVSRTNNCQYCLGHQESKLLAAGRKEDEIAALDGDWSEFTDAQRAAFAFARKITFQPHLLSDADIDGLRTHYKDIQILEMILSVAGNNAINRWKEGAGVPQSANGGNFGRAPGDAGANAHQSYLTPTAEKYLGTITRVAPLASAEKAAGATAPTVFSRPPLESRAEVEKALDAARKRTARLPVLDDDKARAVISEALPDGPLPQWARLLANFPREGLRLINGVRNVEEKGDLAPLLKTRASWVIARQDRAWYATGLARKRLKALGQTDEQIFALDGDWSGLSDKDRAMLIVARKLSASPVVLTDSDVDAAVKLAGPRDVVQLINYITNRASFDRITEAAGLPIEP